MASGATTTPPQDVNTGGSADAGLAHKSLADDSAAVRPIQEWTNV
jgi:hypothetical protein